jgi:hypothetical protein
MSSPASARDSLDGGVELTSTRKRKKYQKIHQYTLIIYYQLFKILEV